MRFSAMGDVAMIAPVVNCLATQHPEVELTVLTRRAFTTFFRWLPANVHTIGIDLDEYKALTGLNRLFKELKSRHFDAVADLHCVLRSKYLTFRFKLAGVKTAVIDKGRNEKKKIMGRGRFSQPLMPTTDRYARTFRKLGLPVDLKPLNCFHSKPSDYDKLNELYGIKSSDERWVGVAPFAAHENKMYPLDRMETVVRALSETGCKVFLFGAGKKEREILERWDDGSSVFSTCGKLGGLDQEMLLMSELDVMLAMDSANMHIASLVGIPVVSIWGSTHPNAGFIPWQQNPDNIIQDNTLDCRPCSVYGKAPCKFGDRRCMTRISQELIISKIKEVISL